MLSFSSLGKIYLKWYCDGNGLFPIEVTLKYKQEASMRRKKCYLLFSNISFRSWDFQVFKICKLAKRWRHIHNQIWSTMMKTSANLYQKCLILCGKILINVLHNMSLTGLLPWSHTGFQTSPILKAFLATSDVPFVIY